MSDNRLLDAFGKLLMNCVRDPSIVASRMSLRGDFQSQEDMEFQRFADSLPEDSKEILERWSSQMIDQTIFHLLTLFEQQQEFILASQCDDHVIDLNQVSDGLGGELWGDCGWIAKYSSPDTYLDDGDNCLPD